MLVLYQLYIWFVYVYFDKYLSSLLQISAKFAVTPFLGIS